MFPSDRPGLAQRMLDLLTGLFYNFAILLPGGTIVAAQFKEVRRTYGFDEVAIAPGAVTINPDQASTEFSIDGITMPLPIRI